MNTSSRQQKIAEKEMPFLDHLEELRWRLVKSILAIFVFGLAAYFFSDEILALLLRPYNQAVAALSNGASKKLIFLTPTGGFMIHLKLAIFAGLIAATPVVFYQLWQFVVPGLLEKERRYVPIVVFFSTACFLSGALFCYFYVLPYGLNFLLGFETVDLVATISINDYLEFVGMMILVFGVVFELPILSFFLTRIGFLTPAFMRHYRRHGIVVIFILAAILTPTTDVFSQLLLAGPLVILYEISILVSKFALKKEPAAAIK
jgi:sec-independent protein translocase protein TatC